MEEKKYYQPFLDGMKLPSELSINDVFESREDALEWLLSNSYDLPRFVIAEVKVDKLGIPFNKVKLGVEERVRYITCDIEFKDNGSYLFDCIIKIGAYDEEELKADDMTDDDIFFYAENFTAFRRLLHKETNEDFVVIDYIC